MVNDEDEPFVFEDSDIEQANDSVSGLVHSPDQSVDAEAAVLPSVWPGVSVPLVMGSFEDVYGRNETHGAYRYSLGY